MTTTLRVMTFNVHQLHDDASAVAQVLRSSGADVVAIQEPPRGPFGHRRLARCAAAAGFEPVVAGGGSRTTALLVRAGLGVTGVRALRLPWRPGRTRRGLAIADVAGLRVISVHLSLDPAERAAHVRRVLLLVTAAGGGCVVAGDLNEDPDGPTWRRLRLGLRDLTASVGPTFTARNPRRRIDAVLVTPGLRGSRAHVVRDDVTTAASDHLPVVVDVTW